MLVCVHCRIGRTAASPSHQAIHIVSLPLHAEDAPPARLAVMRPRRLPTALSARDRLESTISQPKTGVLRAVNTMI